MAGVDKDIEGEAMPMPGLKIGYLPQEPQLDPEQTVREAVEEGMGEVLDAQEASSTRSTPPTPSPTPTSTSSPPSRPSSKRSSPRPAATTPTTQLEIAADALRLPPWDAKIGNAVRRREAPRRAVPAAAVASPTCCCSTSRPTTSTPRASSGSSSSCSASPAPWSAITHDRYFLDNAAEWILELDRGRGIPWKGNYSSWLEQKEQRLEQEQKTEDARARRR